MTKQYFNLYHICMNILITGCLDILVKFAYEFSKIKSLKNVYLLDNLMSNNINVLFNIKKRNQS